jgi:carbon-monoxide dehydrogenase large subunit
VVNNRVVVASIEARAAVAAWEGGKLTLHTNTQGSWLVKNLLAKQVFNIPAEDVRVDHARCRRRLRHEALPLCPSTSGRRRRAPASAARQVGERADEAFQSDTHGRDNITIGELALDADGKVPAMRTKNYANMGAYLRTFAPSSRPAPAPRCSPASTGSRRSTPTCSAS